jgi:hypothetical protein
MRNDIHFGENVSDEAKDDSSASFNLNASRSKENYFLSHPHSKRQVNNFGGGNISPLSIKSEFFECNEKLK